MLGPMNPAHMIRLGPSISPRLAGVSAADASAETIDLAGALPFRIHERLAGGDGAAVAPALTAELPEADPWDQFVVAAPGGDLVQTDVWIKAKCLLGFETCRVVLREGDRLIGGAQIVLKRFGPLGAVGYIARGPLIASDRAADGARLLDEIERTARARGVRHIIVQPPQGGDSVIAELQRRGYAPDAPAVAPNATLLIDLSQSLDQILAGMSRGTRGRVRRSQKAGVETAIGSRSDIDTFHQLHETSARRQGFASLSQSYLQHQWNVLHPTGSVLLILALSEGRPIAGIWLTAFGQTVVYRLPGWNGQDSGLQPNIACHWRAIQWAKQKGYRYYDLGGIDRRVAELLANRQPIPEVFLRSPGAFKIGFGGHPFLFPRAWHFTFVPFGHVAAQLAYAGLRRSAFLQRFIHRFRNG